MRSLFFILITITALMACSPLDSLQPLDEPAGYSLTSSQVCKMGGGVRCMSWQLRGEGAARMLDAVSKL